MTGLEQEPQTEKAYSEIVSGKSVFDASYHAEGAKALYNLARDSCTYVLWAINCFGAGDKTQAAHGSYSLTATPVLGPNGSVIGVHFDGTNVVSLGSAIAWPDGPRGNLDSLPGKTGPLSLVTQTFSWTEPVK